MSSTETKNGVAIPDDDYDKIEKLLEKRKKLTLTNKDKIQKTFYKVNGVIMADSFKDGKKFVEEVFRVRDVMRQQQMGDPNSFLNVVRKKIRETYPDWTEADVDAEADIMNEGNEAIKRLIKAGVNADTALVIVKNTLMSNDIDKDIQGLMDYMAGKEKDE